MAYIGSEPITGNFVYADDITTSATNTYNILVGGVAFSPESANHLIVSLNGVIQKANTSFSVSGSQITFIPSSGTLSSSDSIDFILILGRVNDVGVATTVSDSAITKNKLNLISTSGSPGLEVKGDGSSENGTIQLNCSQNSHGVKISSPAHSAGQSYELILPTGNVTADKVLKVASVSGSGTTGIGQLSFGDASSDFVKVASTTLSSGTASVSLTGMDSTYKLFKVTASDVTLASSENFYFRFINSSGDLTGSSYYGSLGGAYTQSNNSDHDLRSRNYNSSYGRISNFDFSTNATNASSFEMNIPNPSNSATYPFCYGLAGVSGSNGTYLTTNSFTFQYTSAGAITGIKFYTPNGGNINTGSFQLHGIKA